MQTVPIIGHFRSLPEESLELEVRLVKLRLAEGLTNITPTQSDEVLQLQAEKQKLDVRVTALEDEGPEVRYKSQ